MITFQEETLSQRFIKEIADILELHAEELSEFSFSLNPDWNIYQQLANSNVLHIVTVRDSKKLIGYHVSFIHTHQHYAGVVVANSDLHYLLPKYRKGWTGYKFLKQVIQLLKKRNVNIITHSMTLRYPYLSMIERLGFKLTEYKLIMEV